MAVITSANRFIGKQDGGKNMLRQDHRADRKVSRRYHCVPRGGMVNEPERIGGIDGVHDMKMRGSPALRCPDASVAENA